MKQKLLENINKPIKLFKENGGIVGVCEKGGRFLGQTLKGFFNVARFVVEPPVSLVILTGVIAYDYLKKEEDKPLLLQGTTEHKPIENFCKNFIDLDEELKKETITLGAKEDIEQLLGLTRFDQQTLMQQYRKRIKEVHPDKPEGSEFLFNEIQKLMEEIRWKWFIDYNNLNEEDKLKFETLTYPYLRAKSYLFSPKYGNSEMVGDMKIISMATSLNDVYRCRDTKTNNIVFLTQEELAQHEQV